MNKIIKLIKKNNELEKLCRQGTEDGVARVISCAVIKGEKGEYRAWAGRMENKKVDENTIFDLASLTKPLATTLLVMKLIKEGKLSLSDTLRDFFSGLKKEKEEIDIAALLSHSAGFMAHEEYFQTLSSTEEIYPAILHSDLVYQPGQRSLYSDLGFILLGRIVEIVGGRSLFSQTAQMYQNLSLKGCLSYLPGVENKKKICPCQMSDWRGRIVSGEVSDDNCHFMGSIAGHAGLFGDIMGVGSICRTLLDVWQERRVVGFLDKETLELFFKRRNIPGSSWGLGFDHPDMEDSSAGKSLSKNSVGHLGFTGTSFWIDPDHDAAIILLTNRVHPDPENWRIKEFRPFFHDRVMEIFFQGRGR